MSEAGKSPRQFSVGLKREIVSRLEAGEAVGRVARSAPAVGWDRDYGDTRLRCQCILLALAPVFDLGWFRAYREQ